MILTLRRYAPPALAALAGATLVLLLLWLAGWPGPGPWLVVHVAVGGGLVGTWTWTQAHGSGPASLVVPWWPPAMGAALVVSPVLALAGGWAAIAGELAALAVAVASIWVARDCVDRLQGIERRKRAAPPPNAEERLERIERVQRRTAAQIAQIERCAPDGVREYVRRHRSDEGAAPRARGAAHA